MDSLITAIAEFVRVRQLNIAVGALLTLAYLIYQYRRVLFKMQGNEIDAGSSYRLSRSRSRSRSVSKAQNHENKARRGKRGRRCPNCSSHNYD